MSKKSDLVAQLLSMIEPRCGSPTPLEGASLLEQGLLAILQRRLQVKVAVKALENLRKAYPDWNELRVAQKQEIAGVMKIGAQGSVVGSDVRDYLHEVFQRSHGLDLEFLRDDHEAVKRFAQTLPFIGTATLHYLMWQATPGEFPVTSGLMRVLDRVGVGTRISNVKKARAAMAPLVATERRLEFAIKIGEVASRWCNAQKPLCHECAIVDVCKYGKKAFREWKAQQERLEAHRVREEARLTLLRKKEEAKEQREAARARKKAEAEAHKRSQEMKRRAKANARKREAEQKKLAAQRAREDARKKRDDERARKKAALEAQRKAKKVAAERAAKKQAQQAARLKAQQAKKAAAAKKKAAGAKKKASKTRPAKKKTPARKPAAKKPARKKSPASKASKKGSTAKKKTPARPKTRSATKKKPAARKSKTRRRSR